MSRVRLRWGVLGAANIALKAVVPAIQAAGDQVLVLGTREIGKVGLSAREIGVSEIVEGYREVLERDLDAIYIPLPNALHHEWTMAALESGKHVLCEKPLALSVAQALAADTLARRQGLVLAEAVMYRYHPRWRLARELLGQGRIGVLRQVMGGFNFTLTASEDIRWDRELGGGALYDVGSYLINAARWVVGREPHRVVATAFAQGGVDESTAVLLDFDQAEGGSPVVAALSCSFGAAESQWLRIVGTQGCMLLPKPFTAWHGEALPILIESRPGQEPIRLDAPAADPYLEMVTAFGRAVQSKGQVCTSAEDAADTLAVLEACQRSLSTGAYAKVASWRTSLPR